MKNLNKITHYLFLTISILSVAGCQSNDISKAVECGVTHDQLTDGTTSLNYDYIFSTDMKTITMIITDSKDNVLQDSIGYLLHINGDGKLTKMESSASDYIEYTYISEQSTIVKTYEGNILIDETDIEYNTKGS